MGAAVLCLTAFRQADRASLPSTQDPASAGIRLRLGTNAGLHPQSVADLSFSADNRLLASISGKLARVWDVATGAFVKEIEGPNALWAVGLSPRGDLMATGGEDPEITVWTLSTGRPHRVLKGASGVVHAIRFSPDGRTLAAASAAGELRVWEVESGRETHAFKLAQNPGDFDFQAAGTLLASGGSGSKVLLRDLRTGKPLDDLEGQDRPVSCTRFSPQGDRLAGLATRGRGTDGSQDHSICLWDVATGKLLRRLGGRDQAFMNCAFTPDGRFLMSATRGGLLCIWDARDGREIGRFPLGAGEIDPASFSADGRWLAAGTPNTRRFRLWSIDAERPEVREIRALPGHATAVAACRPSRHGDQVVSLGDDGTLVEWNSGTGEVRSKRFLRGFWGEPAGISSGGDIVGLGADLYDAHTGKRLSRVGEDPVLSDALGFSHGGKVAAVGLGASGGRILTVDVLTGAVLQEFRLDREVSVKAVAFSPDDSLLAGAGSDDTVEVFSIPRSTRVHTLKGHTAPIRGLSIAPSGRLLASAGADRSICLWSLESGKEVARLQEEHPVAAVVFSPDGRHLLAGTNGGLSHWDVSTGKLLRRYATPAALTSLSWFADGRHAVSGSEDTTLTIWNLYDPRTFASATADLSQRWKALLSEDPLVAHEATVAFLIAPRASSDFLKGVLRPVQVDAEEVRRIVGNLDSDQPQKRESAYQELRSKSPFASAALLGELTTPRSSETELRIRAILRELGEGAVMPGEQLRRIRAISLLELLADDGSEDLLKSVAENATSDRERVESRAALDRLSKR